MSWNHVEWVGIVNVDIIGESALVDGVGAERANAPLTVHQSKRVLIVAASQGEEGRLTRQAQVEPGGDLGVERSSRAGSQRDDNRG